MAPGEVHSVLGDLASIDNVKRVASEVKEKLNKIDCLINNAGVFMPMFEKTAVGHEMTFAINVLAPYLLTSLLKVTHSLQPIHSNQSNSSGPAGQLPLSQAHQHKLYFSVKVSSIKIPT